MRYRCEATSLIGFIQQLAANYLPHGYWFYVTGHVPTGKDPSAVDVKLVTKYGVGLSRQQRARRKQAGLANVHYLRLGPEWVLLATHGRHRFFEEEAASVRDVRHLPIQVGGYSLSVKRGQFLKREPDAAAARPDGKYRVRVQISRERYRDLRAYFLEIACHRSMDNLAREFWNVPFEPYAPIRKQLLNLLRLVNEKRQVAGYARVPTTVLRLRRRIVKPFEPTDAEAMTARVKDSETPGPTLCWARSKERRDIGPPMGASTAHLALFRQATLRALLRH